MFQSNDTAAKHIYLHGQEASGHNLQDNGEGEGDPGRHGQARYVVIAVITVDHSEYVARHSEQN